MFKKLSSFLFCILFSGGAWAALPAGEYQNIYASGLPIQGLNAQGFNSLAVFNPDVYATSMPHIMASTLGAVVINANTQGTYQQASIAPAATVATLTPPANNALEGWDVSITSNATLAVAGTDTITVALNGVTLYQTSVYIPATALSVAGQMYSHKAKYNAFVVPKVGAAGTFTVTLGTALATGTVNVNEYSSN